MCWYRKGFGPPGGGLWNNKIPRFDTWVLSNKYNKQFCKRQFLNNLRTPKGNLVVTRQEMRNSTKAHFTFEQPISACLGFRWPTATGIVMAHLNCGKNYKGTVANNLCERNIRWADWYAIRVILSSTLYHPYGWLRLIESRQRRLGD